VKPDCKRLKRERAVYEAKARDLLALVGLKGFEDNFPWQLSGACNSAPRCAGRSSMMSGGWAIA
jgi:ABC-type nitrate/sulfonate/bicarbonate transport system ATPase subunit